MLTNLPEGSSYYRLRLRTTALALPPLLPASDLLIGVLTYSLLPILPYFVVYI